MDYQLVDNIEYKQYEFHIDGIISKLEYIKSVNKEIYLTHTEVPVRLQGRGIGTRLVEGVLEDIRGKELKLIPLCPFVADYIRKHPEWECIMMDGFNVQ